ncbi:hypothetical protein EDB89DRAFT_1912989 [Lactarius sanguifluus]|nr:hypothetical protein EDB89DRAFT_1912989 [Lactarius sanguifluus]
MSSSSTTPNLGDALRPDGTLKEASEIIWSYDADKSIPFPSDNVSGQVSGSRVPAMMVAGVRRTGHVPRPSQHAREAAEATSSSSTSTHPGTKRKVAIDPKPDCHVTCKVAIDVDDDTADPNDDGATTEPDDGATTEPDDGAATEPDDGATTEPATDDYESIEAVANADDQAIPFIPREKRLADVRLIFHREKECKHPDTGKIQDGHWCKVCLFH